MDGALSLCLHACVMHDAVREVEGSVCTAFEELIVPFCVS
jgi:hypothetical protein